MKQISFIDQAIIKIKAGDGGSGKMGFHKEKYVEHGGPSGGNGGNGGSIFFIATSNENTLMKYKGKTIYKGNNGSDGGLKNMTGARGENIFLEVPIGTEIFENGKKQVDLQFDGQIWLASQGGKGGRGNKSFKSSKNTAPTLFEYGEKVDWKELTLNLKVLADVGLLGFPNAGKSTLVSSVTNAKPKIANYEFTTLVPQLGVVKIKNEDFVITDLPGLIDGASKNKGMGISFLKHLSRTRIIIHLIDSTKEDLLKKYRKLRKELKSYSKELSEKREIIVFSKCDLINEEKKLEIRKDFKNNNIHFISAITREGIISLLDNVIKNLKEIKKEEQEKFNNLMNQEEDLEIFSLKEKEDPLMIKYSNGIWTISNDFTKYWANRIPLNSSENSWRLMSKFKTKGIIDKLITAGIKDGDMIAVKNSPFIIKYNK
ncbi:MAG: GTPase Obg [Candidatus Tyloplasma litorale]|nr:MAG: GTPase Obg [Mycoplasmatales bacterium]